MDLSKLSDKELEALAMGDLSKLSDESLASLAGIQQPQKEKTSVLEDIGIGLSNAAHGTKDVLDLLAGAAARYTGNTEASDAIYRDMEARQAAHNAELAQKEQGVGGQVISGLTQLVPMAAGGAVVGGLKGAAMIPSAISALSGAGENVKMGASVPQAAGQAAIESGLDYASLAIPGGKGLVKGAVIGGLGNVAGTVASDITGRQLMEDTNAAQRYETTPEKLLVSGLTGAIPGGVFGKMGQNQPEVRPDPYMEKILQEQQVETPERGPLKIDIGTDPVQQQQMGFDLGYPNQYGIRPSDLTVDENGIPIRQEASIEAQTTTRQGDLFSNENLQRESINEAINRWEQPDIREAQPDRSYLKDQEIEQAYLQKKQQDEQVPKEREIPIGQTGFGKGQRGSIGFFGETPQEKYTNQMRKQYPDATPEQIQKAWEMKQQDANNIIKGQKSTQQQSNAFTKATGLIDPKRTDEVLPTEKIIDIASTVGDIEGRSLSKEWLASSSRIQRDLLDHPVTTQIYNFTTKAVEDAGRFARHILDDPITGIFPDIRKTVMLGVQLGKDGVRFSGEKQMRDYFRWRFANEGKDVKLPDSFGPEITAIHEKLNAGYDNLLKDINDVITQQGGKPVKGLPNYITHYWNGPYRAHIYVKDSNGNSRLAYFIAEKSMGDAQKALSWITKNVPNIDTTKSTKIEFVKTDARSRSSMFDNLLRLANEKDPVVSQALEQFQKAIEASESKFLGEHHRQERRHGIQGFTGNKPWLNEKRNYSDALDTIRNSFDSGYQWIAAQKIKMQMSELLQAQKEGKISVGNALAIGQRYIDHALGRDLDTSAFTKLADIMEETSPKFGSARRGAGEITKVMSKVTIPWILMLRGAQAIQSGYQVIQATVPKMLHDISLDESSRLTIPKSLAGGMLDGMTTLTNLLTANQFTHIRDRLLQAINKEQSPISRAIQKATEEYDINRMTLADVGSSKEGGFFKSWGNQLQDTLLNGTMNLFEAPTRTWAFSALARQAVANGHDIDTAIKIARASMDTMVNYGQEASPMVLSKLGVVGEQGRGLHTYMFNYYSQLANYIEIARKQKNPEPLLAYLALTFAAGGAVGFIGMDLADWAVDLIKSAARGTKLDSPNFQKFSVRGWLMDNTPDWFSMGPLSTNTGLGLYGSFTTKVVDPDRTFIENAFPKTLASIELGKGLLQTPKLLEPGITEREKGKILEGVAPKFLTQKIRDKYQNKDGVVYDVSENSPGLPVYSRTEKEQKVVQFGLGLRGLGEVASTESFYRNKQGEKNIQESTKKQLGNFDKQVIAIAKQGKEPSVIQKAKIQEIANSLVGTWGVTQGQLEARINKLSLEFGLPDQVTRRLVALTQKTPGLNESRQIKDLSVLSKFQKERQERYGK